MLSIRIWSKTNAQDVTGQGLTNSQKDLKKWEWKRNEKGRCRNSFRSRIRFSRRNGRIPFRVGVVMVFELVTQEETHCSVHERCMWELALEGAKRNADAAIRRMQDAETEAYKLRVELERIKSLVSKI